MLKQHVRSQQHVRLFDNMFVFSTTCPVARRAAAPFDIRSVFVVNTYTDLNTHICSLPYVIDINIKIYQYKSAT